MNDNEKPDHNHTCAVHQAVLYNSVKKLKALVEDGHSLSCTNSFQQTPLLTSIIKSRREEVIMYLIEVDSDVNAVDCWNRNSLQVAIENRMHSYIVHALIKKGADINMQDMNGRTALHQAVSQVSNVPMLLYYNPDVTIKCADGYTPLINAIAWCNFDAVEDLLDYYSQDDLTDTINTYLVESNWFGLQYTLSLDSSKIFYTFWHLINKTDLLQMVPTFLLSFLNRCSFPKYEWLESLFLILESEIASGLICQTDKRTKGYNFPSLFCALHDKNIDSDDRVALISTFLSLGAEVYPSDIADVLNIYGCGKEFECLIYGCKTFTPLNHPLYNYLVCLGDDYSLRCLNSLLSGQICSTLCLGSRMLQKSVIRNLGYFSMPLHMQQVLLNECSQVYFNCDKIQERFSTIPEFPTLLELSRNQVRNHIVQSYKIKYPYHVLDIVKRLEIPKLIKDIILFKNTIY